MILYLYLRTRNRMIICIVIYSNVSALSLLNTLQKLYFCHYYYYYYYYYYYHYYYYCYYYFIVNTCTFDVYE